MKPAKLSWELREGSDPLLDNRRMIVCFSLSALGCMGLISLYQMGIIQHLPDPSLPGIDSDKVDASEEAYEHLQMGDAFIGMVSYAGTARLGRGRRTRPGEKKALDFPCDGGQGGLRRPTGGPTHLRPVC